MNIISDRVQALFRSKTELEQEVHRHLQQARTFFLIKMFQGTLRRKDLMEKLGAVRIQRKDDRLAGHVRYCAADRHAEDKRYEKEDSELLLLLLFAIANIIEEIIPSEVRLPSLFIDQTQAKLIGGKTEDAVEFKSYLYSITESIQQTVRQVRKETNLTFSEY